MLRLIVTDSSHLLTIFTKFILMTLEERIKSAIRDVPDFPRPGILFKDINPIFRDTDLCEAIVKELALQIQASGADVVCGIESRGFFFGLSAAIAAGKPFIPIRKSGKLPGDVEAEHYNLEYGTATIEMQSGILQPGNRVFLHDDLLATGGTAAAAIRLIRQQGAEVVAASFLVNLSYLPGASSISALQVQPSWLVEYK